MRNIKTMAAAAFAALVVAAVWVSTQVPTRVDAAAGDVSLTAPTYLVNAAVSAAQATAGGWSNLIQGGSAETNKSSVIGTGSFVDLRRARECQLQFTFICDTTAITDAVGLKLGRNVGGPTDTNVEQWLVVSAAANGNKWVTVCTNLSMNSLGGMPAYLYASYITNAAAPTSAITNYFVKVNVRY